jgi:hypothetical protein
MLLVEHEKRQFTKNATTSEMTQFYEDGFTAVVFVVSLYKVPSTAVLLLAQYYMDGPTLVTKVQFYEDGRTQVVLGALMAVFLFCLHGLRVLWPESFIKGELSQHNIDYHSNGWRMLIAWQANGSMVPSSLS